MKYSLCMRTAIHNELYLYDLLPKQKRVRLSCLAGTQREGMNGQTICSRLDYRQAKGTQMLRNRGSTIGEVCKKTGVTERKAFYTVAEPKY
jgi:hypothetical protein